MKTKHFTHDLWHWWSTKSPRQYAPCLCRWTSSFACWKQRRVRVKDTGMVLAKGPSMLKLDNLSLEIYSIYCNMMCLRSLTWASWLYITSTRVNAFVHWSPPDFAPEWMTSLMAMKSLLKWVFVTFGQRLMKSLNASWIGGVISNFNVLTVVHWNRRPFNHYSPGGVILDFNVLTIVHWNRRPFIHYSSIAPFIPLSSRS